MKCQILFSAKNKKKFNLSSADLVQRVVKARCKGWTAGCSKAMVLILFTFCITLRPLAADLFLFCPVWCLVLMFGLSYLSGHLSC